MEDFEFYMKEWSGIIAKSDKIMLLFSVFIRKYKEDKNYYFKLRNGLYFCFHLGYKNSPDSGLSATVVNTTEFCDENGERIEYYYNGKMRHRAHYINNKDGGLTIDGVTESWYENGNLANRAYFKKGIQEGLAEEWHSNGKPAEQLNYINGSREGECKRWNEKGNRLKSIYYKNDDYVE
jgi:antitoxin component YwqK of YwqJK toxin-antitoxin module